MHVLVFFELDLRSFSLFVFRKTPGVCTPPKVRSECLQISRI